MNFKTSEVLAYRKLLLTLKPIPVEGTSKTLLVKQGLVGGTMDRYCLPKEMAGQVIQDVHLTHMHIGVDGTTSQAQKLVWMPGLYTAVRMELVKCAGCIQKQKLQKDARVEYCFHPCEKGKVAQIVHLDLAGPLSYKKEGFKYILGLAANFSLFVMATAIKGKTHEEVMTAFTDNWTSTLGTPKFLVCESDSATNVSGP